MAFDKVEDNQLKDADFVSLYERMFLPLKRYATRFFPDDDDAAEVVQSVLVRLLERKDALLNVEFPEKFLYRAVYNECVNRFSSKKVQDRYKDYNRLRLIEIETENFEETYHQVELNSCLKHEIDRLSEQERVLVKLRYVDGLKYSEIAEEVNLSSRTVEFYLQKIVKHFRKRLKKRGLLMFF